MPFFHGASAGETLLHIIHQGGGALLLAVSKDVARSEVGEKGRLVIATRENVGQKEVVGFWEADEYFDNFYNSGKEASPRQVWQPGLRGLGNPVIVKTTDYLLRPNRAVEAAFLAVRYYLAHDTWLSTGQVQFIIADNMDELLKEATYKPGLFLAKYEVPNIQSLTQ